MPDRVAPGLFPPELVVQVKALACELPAQHDVPLSRWSLDELTRHVCQSGLVAQLSQTTLWRWLHEDAIRPWQHRCWIFPRDPDFAAKAGRILDLYQRQWEGKALQGDEFVISADEKTSVQARRRIHPTLPPQPDRPMKVEHEYERLGAWAYLAAMDVHAPKLFGRCEATSGIAPFDRLVAQAMAREPYRSARRVFWIMDNVSNGCRVVTPTFEWSMALSTPVGSIRSRSTFRLFKERCSRQTTSTPWKCWLTASNGSSVTMRSSLNLLNGSSRARI